MNAVVIRETLRRHFTSVAYWSVVALVAIIAAFVSQSPAAASGWPSFVTLLAIAAGGGLIGPEFSSGTLQLILAKPVNRAVYLLSRTAGVVLAVWTAMAAGAVTEIAGRLIKGGAIPWEGLGAGVLNTAADSLLVVAILALFGSFTRAYQNAALYVGGLIGLAMLSGVLRLSQRVPPFVHRALAWIDNNVYPEAPPRFDRDWLLLVLSNAALALLLACLAFRRREVPYGAD